MKILLSLLLTFSVLTKSYNKTTDTEINEAVRSSLRSGQAHALAARFDNNIELIIDSENVDFPSVRAGHAELILKTFFQKYPPQAFRYIYQGMSAHQRYSTGIYQSAGERFVVYVMMKSSAGNQYVVHTLHFRRNG